MSKIVYTEPTYKFKYRDHVDLQNYCFDNQRSGNSRNSIPEEIHLTVNLPLLKDSSMLDADVVESGWFFELKSNGGKAKYELHLKLPFQVWSDRTKATFDKDTRKLTVMMKCVQKVQKLEAKRRISDDEVLEESFHSMIITDEEIADSSGSGLLDGNNQRNKKPLIEVISESDSGVEDKEGDDHLFNCDVLDPHQEQIKTDTELDHDVAEGRTVNAKVDHCKKRQCSAPESSEVMQDL